MYKIRHNRFLRILEENDNALYISAVAFSMLAEDLWVNEPKKHPVVHGYIHISNIIKFLEKFFENQTDKYILEKLEIEGIFILLSAIYIHDLGMYNYYEDVIEELRGTVLQDDDYIRLRHKHSYIIEQKIIHLRDDKLASFFGSNYDKLVEMHNMCGIKNILSPILTYKSLIGMVSAHHNQKISTIEQKINNYKDKRVTKLGIEDKIKFLASLLQFADALDMSKSRIDQEDFINQINSLSENTIPKEKYRRLDRMFNCYIIDEVLMNRSTDESTPPKTTYTISLKMSLSESNLTDFSDKIYVKRDLYEKRIKPTWDDCTRIIEENLNINISVRVLQENVRSCADKHVPDKFFNLREVEVENISKLINNRIECLDQDFCTYSYVKVYSGVTNIYYGGFERKLEIYNSNIQELFFYREEWTIEDAINVPCGIDPKKFFPEDKERGNQYRVLLKLKAKRRVKTALYFLIKEDDNIIGFIRAYYLEDLSKDEITQKCQNYNRAMEGLGKEIINIHQEIYVPKFEQIINNSGFFKGHNNDLKNTLFSLYRGIYNTNENQTHKNMINRVSVSEFKRLIFDENIEEIDSRYEVLLNRELFIRIFGIFDEKYKGVYGITLSKNINNEIDKCYISYNVTLQLNNLPIENITNIVKYLNSSDLMDIDLLSYRDEAEYAFLLKAFFTIFSALIKAELVNLNEDEKVLQIKILIPKKQIDIELSQSNQNMLGI